MNTKHSIQRCEHTNYKDRCILARKHKGNCFFVVDMREFNYSAYFLLGNGRHWVDATRWPKEVINLPWDVYADVRGNNRPGVTRR